jgi:eukaryotic-like serine/threonine-protein kinase
MAAESSVRPSRGGPRSAADAAGYLTLFELARGGMGTVDLAVRSGEHFSRLFAIKRLHSQFAEHGDARTAFLQEGRVAALLRHPNAVSVLDVGEDARGPYLVMEYVEGAPVSSLITEARSRGELLPVQICLRTCLDAARGLHAAHELVDHRGQPQGFLHRDVSPQNVLVGFDGLARVTDFGVAQTIYADSQTFGGTLKGKLRYMAPERLRFEKTDRRSDLFSLGVVLFEMLAGDHLFDAEGEPEIAQQVLHSPTPDIGLVREGVPLGVVELLFELLARDPAYRPPTAADVAARLDSQLTELEFDEGKVATDAYLLAQFGAERQERQRRVSAALETAAAEQAGVPSDTWRLRLPWLGAVLLVLLGVGVAWLRLGGAGRPDPTVSSVNTKMQSERPPLPPSTPASAVLPPVDPTAEPVPSAGAPRRGARKTPTLAPPAPPRPAAARCDPPFYFDAQGRKRVRRECF